MRYYKINHRRCRFREFLRLSHPFFIAPMLLWIPLKLRLLPFPTTILPRPDSLCDALVPIEQLAEPLYSALKGTCEQAAALGFRDFVFEALSTYSQVAITGGHVRAYHVSGRSMFQSTCSVSGSVSLHEHVFVSILPDGSTIATVNGRPKLDRPPHVHSSYHRGVGLPELLQIHEEKLGNADVAPVPIGSTAELITRADWLTDLHFESLIQRGVYEEVDEQEAMRYAPRDSRSG